MYSRKIPTLTITMPVFNNPRCVKIMIDSIIANTFQDWELLIIDDGSDEKTLTLLRQYECSNPQIHLIQRNEQPKGAQTCRNIGLRKARGEYIIFFDSDDYITPNCLNTRIEGIRTRPELDFMVFPSGVIENDTFFAKHRFLYGYKVGKDDIKSFCRRILPFVVWNNIYRTESLRKNNITWDTNLLSLQDADFNLTTLLCGMKYDYLPCLPHLGYRIDANAGSVSKKIVSDKHRKSTIYAINKFYTSVQKVYGNKYNKALFLGTAFLYNWIFSSGVNFKFAGEIADTVKKHSTKYGLIMQAMILFTKILATVISPKRARQIPMGIYLYKYYKLEKEKLRIINSKYLSTIHSLSPAPLPDNRTKYP